MGYLERYLNPTIQYSGRQKLSSIKVGYINILTLLVFWLAFFGLDASQNCWIYPPSWNAILIYVVVFWRVYHRTYTSKFIFNISFRIVVWTLHFFKHAYLLVAPQSVPHLVVCSVSQWLVVCSVSQWLVVCSVSQWLVVCSVCFIFCTFPHIAFCSYLSLTQPVFVSTYLYWPVCHKFKICIFI